jgi:uncharacterized protein (DUF302 family)
MKKTLHSLTAIICLCILPVTVNAQTLPKPKISGAAHVYNTEGNYQDVKADLIAAIESRGLVISYTAYAANMLARTSEAVGASAKAYDNAEILLFCKADLTYDLTIANPHNLVLCPYSIAIYALVHNPDTIYLSIRRPDLQVAEYASIHSLLEGIIAETLDW